MSLSSIGSYEIVREVGRGGMGIVYEARDPQLNRRVALKVLPRALAFNERFVDRFLREGRMAASLSHPNVVTVYEAGEADRQYFLAMEYIEGTDLRQLLQDRGPLDLNSALHILEQVAAGMDAAHSRGIVHRDIKPENILLNSAGVVKVADFGIARAEAVGGGTQTGTIIGTAEYMSPEQALGSTVGTRSDVYSLACMAYEMLTGHPPFGWVSGERTAISIINDHAHRHPPSARSASNRLRKGADYALQKAMAKQPDSRYATAGEFVSALRYATAPLISRRAMAGAAAAVTALALTASLVVQVPKLWPQPHRRGETQATPTQAVPPGSLDLAKLPPAIEKAARDAIGKPKGALTQEDIPHVTKLSLVSLTDLRPLSSFVRLQELWLESLRTTDLSALATLTDLRELHIDNPEVTDLRPLTNLRELRVLSVGTTSSSKVSDLNPLAGLTKLRRLSLPGSQVSDLRPLANLSALEELSLSNTPVADLAPLENLAALQSLYLEKSRVERLVPLSRLTTLKTLTLNGTRVSDVQPLSTLTGLSRLELAFTQVSALHPLASLTGLESLDLKGTPVSDLTPVSSMTKLHSLDLEGTSVSDLTPLSETIGLEYLSLQRTRVSDLSPLRSLMFLKELDLRSTPVSDLRPIAGQLMLQVLNIADTRVSPQMEASLRRVLSQCEISRSPQTGDAVSDKEGD